MDLSRQAVRPAEVAQNLQGNLKTSSGALTPGLFHASFLLELRRVLRWAFSRVASGWPSLAVNSGISVPAAPYRPAVAGRPLLPESCGNVARRVSRKVIPGESSELRSCLKVAQKLSEQLPREPIFGPISSNIGPTRLNLANTGAKFAQDLAQCGPQMAKFDPTPPILVDLGRARLTVAIFCELWPFLSQLSSNWPDLGRDWDKSGLPGQLFGQLSRRSRRG